MVSVALRSGKIVQRTLMMSARARIHAAPSGEDDAVPHIGSAAPQLVDEIAESTAPGASSRRRQLPVAIFAWHHCCPFDFSMNSIVEYPSSNRCLGDFLGCM
jgi:hypothetical protein